MPVTKVKLPDGTTASVTHPEGASPQAIEERAYLAYSERKQNQIVEEQATQKEKEGYTFLENLASTLVNVGSETPVIGGMIQGAGRMARGESPVEAPDVYEGMSYAQALEAQRAEAEATKRTVAGVPLDKQPTSFDIITQEAINPLNWVGLKNPTKLANIVNDLIVAAGSISGATVPVLLQEAISDVDAYKEMSPLAQDVTTAVLGGLAGAAAGITGATLATGAVKVTEGVVTLPKTLPELLAKNKVSGRINKIRQSYREGELETVVRELDILKEEVPELQTSLSFLAADNPVVKSWLRQVSQEDPAFQANFDKVLKEQVDVLLQAFDTIVGTKEDVSPKVLRETMRQREQRSEQWLDDRLAKRYDALNKKELELNQKLWTQEDTVTIGDQIAKVNEAKENLLRTEADKRYGEAFKAGEEAKTVVAPDEVAYIYDTAIKLRLDDVFSADLPAIRAGIASKWAAKEQEDGTFAFEEVSLKEFDSLKRRIAKDIRLAKDPARIDKLKMLQQSVDEVRSSISERDAVFAKLWKDADTWYWKEKGIPQNAEGMRSISAARFKTTTAKQLNDFEKANDFINFVGKENGLPVLKQAVRFLAKEAGVVTNDGIVDQKKLTTFLSRPNNKRLIELAEMGNEFTDVATNLKTIREAEANQQNIFEELAARHTGGFFKAVYNKEMGAVVREMLSSPEKRQQYLEQINRLKADEKDMATFGIRQAFLAQGFKGKDFVTFVKENTNAVDDIFGAGYSGRIQRLARLTDMLNSLHDTFSTSLTRGENMDITQEYLGVSTGELAGTFRNQILSTQRKIINLMTKATQSKGGESYDKQAAELLLRPDIVEALTNPPFKLKDVPQATLGYISKLFDYYKGILESRMGVGFVRGSIAAQAEAEREKAKEPLANMISQPQARPQGMFTGSGTLYGM